MSEIKTEKKLKEKLQELLTEMFGRIEVTPEGFTFPYESARVFITPFQVSEEHTGVNIYSFTNLDVPESKDLYKFVAMNSDTALFGHLLAVQGEAPSTVNVIMSHRLLGTHLDKGEFEAALFSVVQNANEVDDEIKKRFGGRTFHDAPEEALKQQSHNAHQGGYL